MNKDVSAEAKTLAADLDKFPSGEQIIERLLTAQLLLQRENAELKAQLDRLADQVVLLADEVGTHRTIFIKQGICKPRPEGDRLVN